MERRSPFQCLMDLGSCGLICISACGSVKRFQFNCRAAEGEQLILPGAPGLAYVMATFASQLAEVQQQPVQSRNGPSSSNPTINPMLQVAACAGPSHHPTGCSSASIAADYASTNC